MYKTKLPLIAVLIAGIIMAGCATGKKPMPVNASPVEEEIRDLLGEFGDALGVLNINIVPNPISFSLKILGKEASFELDRDMWFQKIDGEYSAAGTYALEGEPKALKLSQTHFYRKEKYPVFGNVIGWKKLSKPKTIFTLTFSSPPTFKL